jgi:hypothetical protein
VFRRDEAVRLRAEGHSWRVIARTLGVPVMTVRDAVAAGAGCTESVSRMAANQGGNGTVYAAR